MSLTMMILLLALADARCHRHKCYPERSELPSRATGITSIDYIGLQELCRLRNKVYITRFMSANCNTQYRHHTIDKALLAALWIVHA